MQGSITASTMANSQAAPVMMVLQIIAIMTWPMV